MTDTTDTSAEAVRDAALTDARDFHRQSEIAYAERDEARRNARAWQGAAHTAGHYREQERSRAEKAEAERDRLREALQILNVWFDKSGSAISARWDRVPPEDRARFVKAMRTALKETGHD